VNAVLLKIWVVHGLWTTAWPPHRNPVPISRSVRLISPAVLLLGRRLR
jgi:hypothetical protein